MHIGSHDSAVIRNCPLSSDVRFCEGLDIKERLDSFAANGSSHMHFVAFNGASTRSMNPRHLNRYLLRPEGGFDIQQLQPLEFLMSRFDLIWIQNAFPQKLVASAQSHYRSPLGQNPAGHPVDPAVLKVSQSLRRILRPRQDQGV